MAAFQQKFFSRWVDTEFAAGLEARLDGVGAGTDNLHAFLSDFWCELDQSMQGLKDMTMKQVRSHPARLRA